PCSGSSAGGSVVRLAATALLLLSGCAALSLRPVQRDHALRKAEITARLGVDSLAIDATLAADREECDALDNKVTAWTGVSIAGGILAGGGGVTTLLTEDGVARAVVGGV